FRAKGSQILKAGWREIYDADWEDIEDEDAPDNGGSTGSSSLTGTTWPDIREGSELPVTSLSITEGKTKPPAYFTEGTLIEAMENRERYMQHKDQTLAR